MFPSWPTEDRELRRFFERTVRAATIANAPLVQQISRITINEGTCIEMISPDGSRSVMKFDTHSASATFDRRDFQHGGAQAVVDAAVKLGQAMAKEMETTMIEVMKKAPATAGGMLSGSTSQEIGQQFLRGLEQMDFGFDDEGNPTIFVVMHPETAAKLGPIEDPALRAEADAIVARKRDEWLRRESRRRLVD
jgi:hypothetical protein